MRQVEVIGGALACAVWAWVAGHELAQGNAEAAVNAAATLVFTTIVVMGLLMRGD